MKRKVVILGCGSSCGVPRPNQDWGNCDPSEPKNRRRRSSILIEQYSPNDLNNKTSIIIDTSADFSHQLIDTSVKEISAVIYTHAHADHTHGIDDLRSFALAQKNKIPIYAEKQTLEILNRTFGYCFKTPHGSNYPPILEANEIFFDQEFNISGKGGEISFIPFIQPHGSINSVGLRIGKDFAYCTDISAVNQYIMEHIAQVDTLIIDALQYKPHPSHLSVSEVLNVVEIVKPNKVYLTHMHNTLDYVTLKKELPSFIEPAYDNLSIELI